MGTYKNQSDEEHMRRAVAHLDQAAHFAERAAELLSPLDRHAERWERLRTIVFSLRDERDGLEPPSSTK